MILTVQRPQPPATAAVLPAGWTVKGTGNQVDTGTTINEYRGDPPQLTEPCNQMRVSGLVFSQGYKVSGAMNEVYDGEHMVSSRGPGSHSGGAGRQGCRIPLVESARDSQVAAEGAPMPRTTPPRPVDIASVFPELAPLARQAVRLHPRAGRPSVHDSSVGGPLLWPVDEPWPACAEEHHNWQPPVSLGDVRRKRALLEAAWLRPREPHENLLDPGQRAYLDELRAGHPAHTGPNALLPVAQLYLRDVPQLAGPEGADLLQVLWCPLDHDNALPAARLVWRNTASVGTLLTDPPEPADVEHYGSYVPEPCVLHPEVVTEYPAPHELPRELADRLYGWGEKQEEDQEEGPGGAYYQYELSVAPGWKVGGWGPWSFRDPSPMHCASCNAPYKPLFTIDSGEWDGGSGSWIPLEDREEPSGPVGLRRPADPPMVQIGRSYSMQIYICPTSFDHPHLEVMQ